jgi:hypothetical protein
MACARRIFLAIALTTTVLFATAAPGMAARNTQCPKAKGETIVQNGSFRVYQRIKHQP